MRLPADAPAAARDAAARAFARVVLGDRRLDGRGLADRAALPLDGRDAARWPVVFAAGLDEALRAWPGGDRTRLASARAALAALDDLGAGDPRSELAWARTMVEAAIAASQDEHPQMALLLAHAADLETQLIAGGRVHLPLLPTRELAAELWLRTYRYDDARRDAGAVLAASPRRISPAVVLARTAARLQDAAAADAWRTHPRSASRGRRQRFAPARSADGPGRAALILTPDSPAPRAARRSGRCGAGSAPRRNRATPRRRARRAGDAGSREPRRRHRTLQLRR